MLELWILEFSFLYPGRIPRFLLCSISVDPRLVLASVVCGMYESFFGWIKSGLQEF